VDTWPQNADAAAKSSPAAVAAADAPMAAREKLRSSQRPAKPRARFWSKCLVKVVREASLVSFVVLLAAATPYLPVGPNPESEPGPTKEVEVVFLNQKQISTSQTGKKVDLFLSTLID